MHASDSVVLVDIHDHSKGTLGKEEAHTGRGRLHRAVSVLLYRNVNNRFAVLLQKRSAEKLLWPGFWSNTVCSHPRIGESPRACAVRRLREEMGISVSSATLVHVFTFRYRATYRANLTEHELDHVFVGEWSADPVINTREVSDFRWAPWDDVIQDVVRAPEMYAPWFRLMTGHTVLRRIFADTPAGKRRRS
jgi:isopentenyl-diphosphate delta-isomerase